MCITQVTGMIDFKAESPEKVKLYKKVLEDRRKELRLHTKTCEEELKRLADAEKYHAARDIVKLHEVNKRG
jgi:hypothetical protein